MTELPGGGQAFGRPGIPPKWTSSTKEGVDANSTPTGLGIEFVDLPIAQEQTAPIRFTFFWTEGTRWEGRDYEVVVSQPGGAEA